MRPAPSLSPASPPPSDADAVAPTRAAPRAPLRAGLPTPVAAARRSAYRVGLPGPALSARRCGTRPDGQLPLEPGARGCRRRDSRRAVPCWDRGREPCVDSPRQQVGFSRDSWRYRAGVRHNGRAGATSTIKKNAKPSEHFSMATQVHGGKGKFAAQGREDSAYSTSPNSCRSRRSTAYFACRTAPGVTPSRAATSDELC